MAQYSALAVGDAQGVGAGEADVPADRLGRRAGEAAGVDAVRPPAHDQVLVVGDRADLDDEAQVGEDGVDAANPPAEPLASQLLALARTHGPDVDAAIALRAISIWSRLHGFMSLEIAGNFASTGIDPGNLFEAELVTLAA